ncbi:hypothetical protein C8R45DRAFT_1209155 [Mycena sanguinolenta]|nr:hypothetical protein C8R45DRAFT_1209155 [Mycena sanguinolenta]
MKLASFIFPTFLIAEFLFIFSPTILRRYPGPYTTPLADVLAWLVDKFMQGLGSLSFSIALFLGSSLANDAYRGLTGAAAPAPGSPSPMELEEGAATPPEAQPTAEVTPTAAPVPVSSNKTLVAGKILGVLFFSACVPFFLFLFTNGLISSSKPLMENVGALLLYLLRGWEVLFVFGLLGFVVVRVLLYLGVVPSAVAQTRTAAPEVLFEGTLPEENGSAAKQTEKA